MFKLVLNLRQEDDKQAVMDNMKLFLFYPAPKKSHNLPEFRFSIPEWDSCTCPRCNANGESRCGVVLAAIKMKI